MEQVQDTVVGTGLVLPVVGQVSREGGLAEAEAEAEGGAGVERAPSVSRRGPYAERGMVSAEWAVGIVAAVAIAGVLLAVVTSGAVKAALLGIVLKVLSTFLKFAH